MLGPWLHAHAELPRPRQRACHSLGYMINERKNAKGNRWCYQNIYSFIFKRKSVCPKHTAFDRTFWKQWKNYLQTESIQSFMTGEIRGLFEKNASKLATKSSHKALEDSEVRDAWWGDSTTLSNAKSSFGTSGSFSNTSKPAPAISPCTKHHTITFSSTIAPLPTLIRTHFLPNANMTSLLIMWQVWSFNSQQMTKASLLAASSTTLE